MLGGILRVVESLLTPRCTLSRSNKMGKNIGIPKIPFTGVPFTTQGGTLYQCVHGPKRPSNVNKYVSDNEVCLIMHAKILSRLEWNHGSSFKVELSHSKKNFFICLNDSPSKLMKNTFYFIVKALFVLKIFKFLS